ncbi:hypothetical protein UFOVP78_35 [uncultured Caudovirales phage]|uniref:Uncharacterized protein n=1 Tax=uncultured Caudovirales phage TaxID=2100421 RepID=A0A6J5KWX8_9CAUD|nr:hypothetical protein UFOVP78_35 [uncultured Caudovirales phage]
MPATTASRITQPSAGLRAWASLAPTTSNGILYGDSATPAERADWHRHVARQHLHAARDAIRHAYACARRHPGDRRWGRPGTNPEARPHMREVKLALRAARAELRDAAAWDVAAERRAAA